VIVFHAAIVTADDYLSRREPHRKAHIERLLALREQGTVIGGGPAADGRSADVFYRVEQEQELKPLVEEDPYWTGGAWTGYTPRSFSHFVEPWELPPVVLDGSRRVMIVEGPTADHDMAQFALIELRGAGRLAFGGFFGGGETLAVMRSEDAKEATGWLAETGFWDAGRLTARPLLHAL
jgi:uncharacterized protein YciI